MILRTRLATYALLLFCAWLLVVPSRAAVTTVRLANGITVVAQPNTWNRIVAVCALVEAGSKFDPPDLRGLANITANLLLTGTQTRTAHEIADLTDRSGISLDAVTTEDYAEISVTSMDSQFDTALDVLASVMVRPSFEKGELLEQKRLALGELEGEVDRAFDRTYSRVNELLFGTHPYAYPVVGTRSGVEAISRTDILDFYAERYVSRGTVIAVVGNFSPDDVIKRIASLFADYPDRKPRRPTFPALPPSRPRRSEFFKDVALGYVHVGFLAPSIRENDFASVRVLDGLLGNGVSSRLFLALGEDGAGVADVAGSFFPGRQEHGRYVIFASTGDVDRALEIVGRQIEAVKSERVSAEDLARAKNRVIGELVVRKQTNHERARVLAWAELLGLGPDYVEAYRGDVERVTAGDVMDAARKYLVNGATVITRPGKKAKSEI